MVQESIPAVRETVPAFNSLLIEFEVGWDPDRVAGLLPDLVRQALEVLPRPHEGDVVVLPACYDPELAPDLIELTERSGLSIGDVASLHSAVEYTVLATGFSPGFAYLGDVDERLAMPRRPSPRPLVETGSIGIADRRTAVYPSAGPGGWQLVGRVPPSLFEDASVRLARHTPGGRVRFEPVDRRQYEAEA